jgi:hypothetical protein
MTKNITIDYKHINRPFFFVFFPLFPGDAGVGSRNDGEIQWTKNIPHEGYMDGACGTGCEGAEE